MQMMHPCVGNPEKNFNASILKFSSCLLLCVALISNGTKGAFKCFVNYHDVSVDIFSVAYIYILYS